MQWYLFALTVCLAPLVHGYLSNTPYPIYAPCDPYVISSVRDYWSKHGIPQNIQDGLERAGVYTIYHDSFDLCPPSKVIYHTYSQGILNMTFVPKDGSPVTTLLYTIDLCEEGVLKATPVIKAASEATFIWYAAIVSFNSMTNYVCSEQGGSPQNVNGAVMESEYKGPETPPITKQGINLVKSWGYYFKYNYNNQKTA